MEKMKKQTKDERIQQLENELLKLYIQIDDEKNERKRNKINTMDIPSSRD